MTETSLPITKGFMQARQTEYVLSAPVHFPAAVRADSLRIVGFVIFGLSNSIGLQHARQTDRHCPPA